MQAAGGRRAAARAGSSGLLAQDADDATKKWLLFSFYLTGVKTESYRLFCIQEPNECAQYCYLVLREGLRNPVTLPIFDQGSV